MENIEKKIRFLILPEREFILVEYQGLDLTIDDIIKGTYSLWNHELYSNKYNRIVDLRRANVNMDLDILKDLFEKTAFNDSSFRGNLAFLIGRPKMAAFTYVYKNLIKNERNAEVFTTPENALKYTDGPRNAFQTLRDSPTFVERY